MYEEVCKHLQEMLEVGVIRPSSSYGPLWWSCSRNGMESIGSALTCADWTTWPWRDAYSLPQVQETLECFHGTDWFMSLDLKLGYWQVRMKEECKAYTAFTVSPLGLNECEHMPFGLTNVPATFQHIMEMCLGDLQLNWCIIYLDNIIVFTTIPKEHLNRLQAVFTKLWGAGLKLEPQGNVSF